jgi:hypothetical protein
LFVGQLSEIRDTLLRVCKPLGMLADLGEHSPKVHEGAREVGLVAGRLFVGEPSEECDRLPVGG